jgi:hypothetical protein
MLAMLDALSWTGEANQASLCTGAAPPPHASPPQLLRSTQTTDYRPSRSFCERAGARAQQGCGGMERARERTVANLGTSFLPLERQYPEAVFLWRGKWRRIQLVRGEIDYSVGGEILRIDHFLVNHRDGERP